MLGILSVYANYQELVEMGGEEKRVWGGARPKSDRRGSRAAGVAQISSKNLKSRLSA